MEEYQAYQGGMETMVNLRDIEDRQRLLRDRILLIGKNLIETKENTNKELGELKRDVETIKSDLIRIKAILTAIAEELGNTAKRAELLSLENQFRMFSPMEVARIEDVEKMIREHKNK